MCVCVCVVVVGGGGGGGEREREARGCKFYPFRQTFQKRLLISKNIFLIEAMYWLIEKKFFCCFSEKKLDCYTISAVNLSKPIDCQYVLTLSMLCEKK